MRPFHDQDVRQASAACCRVRTGGARSHEVPLASFSREMKSTKDFSSTHQDLPIRIILTCSSLRESRRGVRPGSWMRWRWDGRDAFLSGLSAQVFSGITDEGGARRSICQAGLVMSPIALFYSMNHRMERYRRGRKNADRV